MAHTAREIGTAAAKMVAELAKDRGMRCISTGYANGTIWIESSHCKAEDVRALKKELASWLHGLGEGRRYFHEKVRGRYGIWTVYSASGMIPMAKRAGVRIELTEAEYEDVLLGRHAIA